MADTWREAFKLSKLIIAGAGGFGREVRQWALDAQRSGTAIWKKICFIADGKECMSNRIAKDDLIGTIAGYRPEKNDKVLIAIADPVGRRDVFRRLSKVLTESSAGFATLFHPSAIVADDAHVSEGCILCPNSLVSVGASIGQQTHINVGTTVGHDARIGAFNTLSAQCDVTGAAVLEDEIFFGTGARVLPGLRIAKGSRIGAGVVVARSIKVPSTVYLAAPQKVPHFVDNST